jgi:hypothetical protein
MIRMNMRWGWMIGIMLSWWSNPLCGLAETSFSIPRPSSTTEKQLQEELLYLKEETVSIASQQSSMLLNTPTPY